MKKDKSRISRKKINKRIDQFILQVAKDALELKDTSRNLAIPLINYAKRNSILIEKYINSLLKMPKNIDKAVEAAESLLDYYEILRKFIRLDMMVDELERSIGYAIKEIYQFQRGKELITVDQIDKMEVGHTKLLAKSDRAMNAVESEENRIKKIIKNLKQRKRRLKHHRI